jgi:2-oxo-4-hydroxy-4-carboxy-5-ureidoimidazoline decarboxylase
MAQLAPSQHALAAFNSASPAAAEQDVLSCCASRSFARAIAAGRPYQDLDTLREAIDAAFAALTPDDIDEAISAHPRIGERRTDQSRESGWSRSEQSGAAAAGEALRQALTAGNLAYEERFGQVFLICATGLSGEDMLAQLQARLRNDLSAERIVVHRELLKITHLRMTRLMTQ